MVDPRRLIDAVDGPAALNFLAKMISFKSYSGEPGEADLARFMVNAMKTVGLEAELSPVPEERFNAIGTLKGTGRVSCLTDIWTQIR